MIYSFGDRIFGPVTIVGLDAIIVKTKFKILEIFTTLPTSLSSGLLRFAMIPLLTPSLTTELYFICYGNQHGRLTIT